MKRTIMAVLLVTFVLIAGCGSTTASHDTTPREAKVIALTGTLMAFVANRAAEGVVYDLMATSESGTITTPVVNTYPDLGLMGASDDTLIVDGGSFARTTVGSTTTLTLTGISYSSEMVEYPKNTTTPFAGAVINFDNIDFTVVASTDTLNINGSITATLKGTGELTDLTPTEYTTTSNDIDIGTMTVSILDPEEKEGTVTFAETSFWGAILNGQEMSSTLLTATVAYAGSAYSCTILASFTPTLPGNTGIGELTVTSATCD